MNNKKVELLAPAGNYTCFLAALNAGADAVYIGGSQYGARAYADNFSAEEIIEAIHVSHLLHKKLYMTVNTLVKNRELDELTAYMMPFYEAGLDGVIIQDMGVFQVLKANFPGLELHASTQMTLTGQYGAEFLKSIGACRIVPARELSLEEIKEIKKHVDIEIEAFIHGAMCYAYSGQCLFSSILGGRSGNRGRCAGPCRLPYEVKTDEARQTKSDTGKKQDIYPLSLKDMYTLRSIPDLIEAGIDSFKIEGRMKSPEYVAGVTSVYRKYIDQYLQHPKEPFVVTKEDEDIVTGLYVRSGLQEGYYHTHNGKDMVTLQGPGYAGTNDAILNKIQAAFLQQKPQIPVFVRAVFEKNQPCRLYFLEDEKALQDVENEKQELPLCGICVTGDVVQQAQKRPLSKEDLEKQLSKMGDTYFSIEKLSISAQEDIFMPIKAVNELRRMAVETYQKYLLQNQIRTMPIKDCTDTEDHKEKDVSLSGQMAFSALVQNQVQLEACLQNHSLGRIYIDVDFATMHQEILQKLSDASDKTFYLAFPYILRKRSYRYLAEYQQLLTYQNPKSQNPLFEGVLIRNIETLQWLHQIQYQGIQIADANIYVWNQTTKDFYAQYMDQLTVPTELNRKERRHLPIKGMEAVVYGRIPMMYSANCTRKTTAKCTAKSGFDSIIDRYKNEFPIFHNCRHCYNVIFNTVPLSLHQYVGEMKQDGIGSIRIEFTNESKQEIDKILTIYTDIYQTLMRDGIENKAEKNTATVMSQGTYTTGHYKRGVE